MEWPDPNEHLNNSLSRKCHNVEQRLPRDSIASLSTQREETNSTRLSSTSTTSQSYGGGDDGSIASCALSDELPLLPPCHHRQPQQLELINETASSPPSSSSSNQDCSPESANGNGGGRVPGDGERLTCAAKESNCGGGATKKLKRQRRKRGPSIAALPPPPPPPPPPLQPRKESLSIFEALEQFTQFGRLKNDFGGYRSPIRERYSHGGGAGCGRRESHLERDLQRLRQRYRGDKRFASLEASLEAGVGGLNPNSVSLPESDSSSDYSTDYSDHFDDYPYLTMAYTTEADAQKEAQKLRWRKWTFWSIVFFLACLTVKDVGKLVFEYMGNPKKADISIMFNESMTMPNITFCMSRAQAWSHFQINASEGTDEWDRKIQGQLHNMTDRQSFLAHPWDYRMVMESFNLISALTSMEQETEVQSSAGTIQKFTTSPKFGTMRKNLAMWLVALAARNLTFDDWVQKTGRETLRRSMQRFQRTTYKEDEEVLKTGIRISWISQLQMCYQPEFDATNFKPIDEQGSFFTMVLSHNAENLNGTQVDCMSIDFHGRPSSMSRLSGHKGEARDGYDEELCLGMRHETTVEVKARYKLLENSEEGKSCKDIDPGEDSQHDCQARCRLEFIRTLCKCTPPSLSYLLKDPEQELAGAPLCNYSRCDGVDAQKNNYTDGGCSAGCRRNCIQIRYQLNHETKGRNMRPDLTTVYLKWGSFEFLNFEQDLVYTPASFIAALGGALGMWLGLSILSLIQGGNFLYSYCTTRVAEKRRVSTMKESQSRPDARSVSPAVHRRTKDSIHASESGNESSSSGKHTAPHVLAPKRNPLESPFKRSQQKLSQVDSPPEYN